MNPTISVLVALSTRLTGRVPRIEGPKPNYEARVATIVDAATSWSDQMAFLEQRIAHRPTLSPARAPSRRMPSPDGWDGEVAGFDVPYWALEEDDRVRLCYTPGVGWGVYRTGDTVVIEVSYLADIAEAVDELVGS